MTSFGIVWDTFGEPSVGPGFCPLGLPQDFSAELPGVITNMMENIATELAFGPRLDQVERELGAQLMFERDLERLPLSLL